MIGMGIAILTTLVGHAPSGVGAWFLVLLGLGIGGGAGAVIAKRVPMTAMPQLVAAFHSLVGLAAVAVAAGALYAPQAFGIIENGAIHKQSLFEKGPGCRHRRHHLHRLGDRVPEARRPHVGQADHAAAAPRHQHRVAIVLVALLAGFIGGGSKVLFWLIVILSFVLGGLLIIRSAARTCRSWSRCSTRIRAGRPRASASRWATSR